MSAIHQQKNFYFPNKDLVLSQEKREVGTHGSAVEINAFPSEGAPEVIFHVSWDYRASAEKEAEELYNQLLSELIEIEGNLDALPDFLEKHYSKQTYYDPEQEQILVDEISIGLYQENILLALEKLGIDASIENGELAIAHEVATKFSDRMFAVAQRELEAALEALKEEGIFEETQESAPDFSHHTIYKILLPEVLNVAHDNMELSEEQFSEADAIALTNRLCEDRKSDAEEFNVYLTDIEEMQDDDDWSDVNGAIAAMIKKYLSEKEGN